LLEAAVRRLKRMPPKMVIDVDVDLPGEAFIPDDYVPDMRMKIDLYRRLTRVAGDRDLNEYRAELADRFGPPPEPVTRMLSLAELKLEAAVWQINRIHQEDEYLVFTYTEATRIAQLSRRTGGKLRVVDEASAYLTMPQRVMPPDDIIRLSKSVLRAS
jgi:transcription-repair coupling factor (superfamily II helicase)